MQQPYKPDQSVFSQEENEKDVYGGGTGKGRGTIEARTVLLLYK